ASNFYIKLCRVKLQLPILSQCVRLMRLNFGFNAIVVFDGYPTEATQQSTKAAERLHRALLYSSIKFAFSKRAAVTMPQDKFLFNEDSKSNLILM
ncbi:hypothetical protein ILUMI_20364, partial [Ignelater luminosus]